MSRAREAWDAISAEVPGMLDTLDARILEELSSSQGRRGVSGDMLEIGAWRGRSTSLLGFLLSDDERLHVCDLWELPSPTEAGRREHLEGGEPPVTRGEFEANYLRFHPTLPVIHQCPSSDLAGRVEPPVRLAHIDGSHLLEAVVADVAFVRSVLAPGGLAVFDDYANIGHPGVAAGVWPSLGRGEFVAFACTPAKLYASDDAEQADVYRADVERLVRELGLKTVRSEVHGTDIVTVWPPSLSRSLPARVLRRVRRELRRVRGGSARRG